MSYTHDVEGNRTSRMVGGVVRASWAWDDVSALPVRTGEFDQAGSLVTGWLVDPTSATGSALAESSGAISSWLLTDPFANVTSAINTVGAAVSLAESAIGFAGQYLDVDASTFPGIFIHYFPCRCGAYCRPG